MSDPSFELTLDFNSLADFCLESASSFLFSAAKDLTFERALIKEALDVWCACVIQLDQPLAWERKAVNIEEKTRVRNLSDFIREGLTCSMPEVRRFLFQSLGLICEQLSHDKNQEPYKFVINEII